MSHIPFFSVVIPVYNKEQYIARVINSVLNQTFEDFELLIVCDPSSDNSNVEVAKFRDPRIRVFHRDHPGPGGYAARNLGIRESSGEWVAFLDADDEWYPEHLQKMADLSVNYPDVFFMGCGWELVSRKVIKEDSFYLQNRKDSLSLSLEDYLNSCLINLRPVHTSIACVKRSSSVVRNLFPAESGAKRGGDLHAWLKMICHHKKMAWSNHVGVKYFLDIEGQVVKSAPYSLHLYQQEVIKHLRKSLSNEEIKLLHKYLNKRLLGLLIDTKIKKVKSFSTFNFLKAVNFSGDLIYGSVVSLLSITPSYFFTIARNLVKNEY